MYSRAQMLAAFEAGVTLDTTFVGIADGAEHYVDAQEPSIEMLTVDPTGVVLLHGGWTMEEIVQLVDYFGDSARKRGAEAGQVYRHLPLIINLTDGRTIETLTEADMAGQGWMRAR